MLKEFLIFCHFFCVHALYLLMRSSYIKLMPVQVPERYFRLFPILLFFHPSRNEATAAAAEEIRISHYI